MSDDLSPRDPYDRRRMDVLDSTMAYVDTGSGSPIILLHGNPTSSYLWRNVIPHLESSGRCLAPDLIGMGESGPAGDGRYRFVDHARYFDAWMDGLDLDEPVTFVLHDWGSGLGFHWARRHPSRVRGIAYMEAIVKPMTWEEWPDDATDAFRAMRSEEGEQMVLENNFFVEVVLPGSILRDLNEEEMDVYREPYRDPGESRRPTLTWPREVPIDGEPEDVREIVGQYAEWLSGSGVPKLFVNGDPGAILVGPQREFCRSWPNQKEVTVEGVHFLQEDSPAAIGRAVADFVETLD